ncbi:MAG: IS1380 family transposase [Candidatus Sulfotelmatobacter sp.]
MSDDSTTQCLLFPGIFRKPVVAQFDQREGSSDGGALLLKAADRHYDLVAGLASCLRDDRQAGKVDHSLRELVAQRVFSIACGYPDANDSARLSEDPIHKLLLDRDPIEGRDLASQPTLSRFENGVRVKELYRSGEFLAESVIRRHAKRLRHRTYRVTIDLDPTDDPTHGAQQLSFFNGHYDTWCYLPVMGFVSFNDEADQYLCAAVLRPGNVTAAAGAVAILRRLLRMIRHHLPGVQIRVRLDGGFAHPAVLAFLDAQPRLEYVVAMAKNAVLKRVAETGMRRARQLSRRSEKTEHIYGEVRYKAGKWPGLRRVIIKAEVVRAADKDPRDNPRFVITNMKQSPQWIYERVYCQRGDIENRIKELHDLEIDRTSCTSFWANQFRVLLTAAGVCSDAGVALAGCRHRLCPRSSLHVARTTAEARSSGVGLGSTRRRPSTRFLPVSIRFPSRGAGARRGLASGRNHEPNRNISP